MLDTGCWILGAGFEQQQLTEQGLLRMSADTDADTDADTHIDIDTDTDTDTNTRC